MLDRHAVVAGQAKAVPDSHTVVVGQAKVVPDRHAVVAGQAKVEPDLHAVEAQEWESQITEGVIVHDRVICCMTAS